jgi:hypothetical protein
MDLLSDAAIPSLPAPALTCAGPGAGEGKVALALAAGTFRYRPTTEEQGRRRGSGTAR